jgi:hypothetical protein
LNKYIRVENKDMLNVFPKIGHLFKGISSLKVMIYFSNHNPSSLREILAIPFLLQATVNEVLS